MLLPDVSKKNPKKTYTIILSCLYFSWFIQTAFLEYALKNSNAPFGDLLLIVFFRIF